MAKHPRRWSQWLTPYTGAGIRAFLLSQLKTRDFTPGFLSHTSSQPALTRMVFVKRNVLLPSIQLHWKKPPHGSDVFHNVNLADTRTTAIWASQLILLCSLPEQTFTRQGELEGRMKNKTKHKKPSTTQSEQNWHAKHHPPRKKISLLRFKLGFAAPVQVELLLSRCPSAAWTHPVLRTLHHPRSLQAAAAWHCVNAGEELHRNHNKKWQGCSQSGLFFPTFNFPAVRLFFFLLSQLRLRQQSTASLQSSST